MNFCTWFTPNKILYWTEFACAKKKKKEHSLLKTSKFEPSKLNK